MNGKSTFLSDRAAILLAPGFEEGDIIYCLDRLRDAGITVDVVGLTTGLIRGIHGVVVRPDHSLDQLLPEQIFSTVIVPGGQQSTNALLADPRVHRMLKSTLSKGGWLAALLSAEPILKQFGFPNEAEQTQFVAQRDACIMAFTNQLIDRLVPV